MPSGYRGALPQQGFHIAMSRTNRLVVFYRLFVEQGDLAAATARVNFAGMTFNMVSANDFSFYEEHNALVPTEPAHWTNRVGCDAEATCVR